SYTLDLLLNRGKRIVMTGPEDLSAIKDLNPHLASKLNSALKISLQPPDQPTRTEILVHKAKKAGLRVDREILEQAASELALKDVRPLEGFLSIIRVKSELLKKPVTSELIRESLAFYTDSQSTVLSPENIIALVCQNFRITEKEIKSSNRRRETVEARSMAMYLIRELSKTTLEQTGAYFDKTHSTVIHLVSKLTAKMETNQKLRDIADHLKKQLSRD
ncbi:MAG: hypothetical protein LBK52_08015, partial [Deltaproteobacteria bacterium]|nr:hypothetical protein [Deltaproteobacteria bacterium]